MPLQADVLDCVTVGVEPAPALASLADVLRWETPAEPAWAEAALRDGGGDATSTSRTTAVPMMVLGADRPRSDDEDVDDVAALREADLPEP